MNSEQVAWAAGLYEGEGNIYLDHRRRTVNMRIQMTDEDVVRRMHETVGGRVYGPIDQTGRGTKPIWVWSMTGFHNVGALLELMWPWLGQRRRSHAQPVLDMRATVRQVRPRTGRTPENDRYWKPATCHPEKRRMARGLCTTCYQRERRSKP